MIMQYLSAGRLYPHLYRLLFGDLFIFYINSCFFFAWLEFGVCLNRGLVLAIFTMLVAGQIAVFSSFEYADLQIEE